MATENKSNTSKKIVFDGNIRNNFKKNPVGSIGFVLSIIGLVAYVVVISNISSMPIELFDIINDSSWLLGVTGIVMSIIGLGKKPNGLAVMGLSIGLIQIVISAIVYISFLAKVFSKLSKLPF